MKKLLVASLVLALLLASSVGVMASSFKMDGMFLFGKSVLADGEANELDMGVLANLEAELFNNFLLSARFMKTFAFRIDDEGLAEGESIGQTIMSIGGGYRVFSDPTMSAYVGAGFSTVELGVKGMNPEVSISGSGYHLAVGASFEVYPKITLFGDVSYAPKITNFKVDNIEKVEGSALVGRVGVSYSITEMIGVEAGFVHSKVGTKEVPDSINAYSSNLIGAGIVINF
ncbi:MAG: porin family protein [Firmicutes bacterium]|nr:porin family protein [Bacillota bacterium]